MYIVGVMLCAFECVYVVWYGVVLCCVMWCGVVFCGMMCSNLCLLMQHGLLLSSKKIKWRLEHLSVRNT